CERALPCLKVNMQLFEQTTHSRVLKEYEFCFADHDLLMPIPHMVCIVRPLLRRFRPHDVHSFKLLLHLDDCLLPREDEIVTGLQDGSRGKGYGDLQARVGAALPMPLAAFLPHERECIPPVVVVLSADFGGGVNLFNDGHRVTTKKENSAEPAAGF